jgi:hypothetical protein
MTFPENALDQLASQSGWRPDWDDVLARANESPVARRPVTRRRLILALAVVAAVLVPLAALAAANDWWFFKYGQAPTPTSAPVVVKTGNWNGHRWELVAYPSTTDGLCFSVTPTGQAAGGAGGALSCGPFAGISRTGATKPSPDMTITFLSTSDTPELPAYMAGPVIDTASTVEIRLANGQTLTTAAFDAPSPLEHIRFYATPLPVGVARTAHPGPGQLAPISWVAGLDAEGAVVACLAPQTAENGISPTSACR